MKRINLNDLAELPKVGSRVVSNIGSTFEIVSYGLDDADRVVYVLGRSSPIRASVLYVERDEDEDDKPEISKPTKELLEFSSKVKALHLHEISTPAAQVIRGKLEEGLLVTWGPNTNAHNSAKHWNVKQNCEVTETNWPVPTIVTEEIPTPNFTSYKLLGEALKAEDWVKVDQLSLRLMINAAHGAQEKVLEDAGYCGDVKETAILLVESGLEVKPRKGDS